MVLSNLLAGIGNESVCMVCPLYRGCPYFRESVQEGSTVCVGGTKKDSVQFLESMCTCSASAHTHTCTYRLHRLVNRILINQCVRKCKHF